ncbi:hypothetical protein ACWCPJ_36570 [Streptomyces collinus]
MPCKEAVEVVQRTVTLPARRLSGQPYALPEDALEWVQALAALRREAVGNPQVAPFREQLAAACERSSRALRSEGS